MQLFLATAQSIKPTELPVPPMVYGIAIFAALMFLLLAILSLRSVAKRHEPEPSTDPVQTRQGSTSANS